MSIRFEKSDNELILCYSPYRGTEYIKNSFSMDEGISIKNTFFVTKSLLRKQDDNEFDIVETVRFCIGTVEDCYVKIDSEVIGTNHCFYFSTDISLKLKMFIANNKISVLRMIDECVENDVYIGGSWEKHNGISEEAFQELISTFPNHTELVKYAYSRIANILKEYFPECDKYQEIYEKYIDRKIKKVKNENSTQQKTNLEIEYAQFSTAISDLQRMLDSKSIEKDFQKTIQDILLLLYPKYILCTREVKVFGVDGHDKQPDFMLVDINGFIDILEIKTPYVQILTKQASYRNNYVPVREFAGAIQQIEKYIFCLATLEKNKECVFKKLNTLLPDDVNPKIVNPQGILLLGRSCDFNEQQKQDFELIKRQYKNIADIMTYDDLVQRLKNVVLSLESRIAQQN